MKKLPKSTSAILVVSIFLCVFMISSLTVAESRSSAEDRLNKIRDFNSNLVHFRDDATLGRLQLADETITFPWASPKTSIFVSDKASFIIPHSPPSNEKILMNRFNSKASLNDLSAINTVKQRDLIYEDSQNGDPGNSSLTNDLNIEVTGIEKKSLNELDDDLSEDDGIEQLVDNALGSALVDNAASSKYGNLGTESARNNLNIEVSGITTKAINTVEGGRAIATSNIIIKPVQIIVCSPEVGEKLK